MTRIAQRGMTLIELLVAMTIGLAVTLVVTTLLIAAENHKRTTTSTNDAEQTGNYGFYSLDRALRSAGSAIAESAFPKDAGVLGCKLNVNGLLPSAAAFPAPFATNFLGGAPSNLRVAPVLIGQAQSDNGSDVLVVMGGSGAAGGVSRPIDGAGSASSLVLQNTVGFVANDLALVSQSGITDCLLVQVSSASGSALNLNTTGIYYTSTSTSADLDTLAASLSSYVTPLGNAAANNVQFQLFGVGTDNVLYSYDLLQNQKQWVGTGGNTSQAIADEVVSLNAIYGVQITSAPGVLDHWVSPAATGPTAAGYDINTVMTSEAKMESIIAVHVALVVRGEYYDRNGATEGLPTTITVFSGYTDGSGNSLSQNIGVLSTYRYRVFEFTVPLRNMLLLAGA